MIYRPLLFGGYLARVAVLIEHVGLGLHQGSLTLQVLNLLTFTTENKIRLAQLYSSYQSKHPKESHLLLI